MEQRKANFKSPHASAVASKAKARQQIELDRKDKRNTIMTAKRIRFSATDAEIDAVPIITALVQIKVTNHALIIRVNIS